MKRYYEDGTLWYDNDDPNRVVHYHPNGQMWMISEKNRQRVWFPNGNIKYDTITKDGSKEGPCDWYNPDGSFYGRRYYVHGEKKSS